MYYFWLFELMDELRYLLEPLINSPPAHPDTVLTSVVYMMKSLQELGMAYAQLSPDMQLYIQALQIKLSD